MKRFILFILLSISVFAQSNWTPFGAQYWTVGSVANSAVYTAGSVGIGIASPGYTLHVNGNIFGTRGFWGDGSSSVPSIAFAVENTMGFYRPGTGQVVFIGGNLGVGGTSPGNRVYVSGGMRADTVLYTTLVNLSDVNQKWDIKPITWNMTRFNEVIPIYYKYKKEVYSNLDDSTAESLSQLEHTGFSAQDFNSKIAGNDSKQIDLMQINVALWLKVQELESRIKQLEQK